MTNEDIMNIVASAFSTNTPKYILKAAASMAVIMKDHQFKEYLERKKAECNGTSCSTWEVYDEIINKLFLEQEQDSSNNDE